MKYSSVSSTRHDSFKNIVIQTFVQELDHGLVLDESLLDTAQASCFFGHELQNNFACLLTYEAFNPKKVGVG